MSTVSRRPKLSTARAESIAAEGFAIRGSVRELSGERDQNFLVRVEGGGQLVLKVANPDEERGLLEAQNAVLDRLAAVQSSEGCFPTLVPARDGSVMLAVRDGDRVHQVRMLTHVPGRPLAEHRPHVPELLADLGAILGRLDVALAEFEHPALRREFRWDLQQAPRVLGGVAALPEPLHAAVAPLAEVFAAQAQSRLDDLPRSVIHADANDYNVLVATEGPASRPRLGLIDFGDMVHSYTVGEPAIAAVYAMLGKRDPLRALRAVVAGYHAARPLAEIEVDVLWGLVCARLCMSVVHAATQRAAAPDNDYLAISQAPIQQLCERLGDVHPRWARGAVREVCGFAPWPHAAAVARRLDERAGDTVAILDAMRDAAPPAVLDLSVESVGVESVGVESDDAARSDGVDALTKAVFDRIAAAGASIGIGRYAEPRLVYTSDQFGVASDEQDERRTVHLGIDLFAPADTAVRAPLDGLVHSLRWNDARLDYGPTIVLRHGDDEAVFYTLYGHLRPDALDRLEVGRSVRAGELLAHIGSPPHNGGWPPHVHFQLILDLLDADGDFPGVAPPGMASLWRAVCPDPSRLLGLEGAAWTAPDATAILEHRRRALGPTLSVSYRRPLHIVRGRGAWLYDAEGRGYLDAVNNVAHVGHCHPRVVRAAQQQMAVLNTNTRYLHAKIVQYAERLAGLLPDPLEVCYFVCSGSEANELALRLAAAHTGRRDLIVLDGAYHGNTSALIDASPYKHDGPGGAGAPAWVRTVPMPDAYRGRHRGPDPELGTRYAAYVGAAAAGRPVTFLCESLLGCGGQLPLPAGYLREAYQHVRAAGGVCIADEVQVGFGRVGSRFWGFELQDVVPDIVTLGKPIGNGHPLAAVVTTPDIAASFTNGMEYFNTYGGNPVSCAVGLAVLDVIEEEGLQQRAGQVGALMLEGLGDLQRRFPLLGDVRGAGLFLGVQLASDPETRSPAPDHADYIVNRMRDHGVLLSTDGPHHDVLKIKPPLAFSSADAERLLAVLERVLGEHPLR